MVAFAYYNEIDPYCVAWLRNLIAAGHIPDGLVDDRSIVDVRPEDLASFDQCHFFAGLGGWAYAARLAGWPDGRPIWTGSCPCQPWSVAGQGKGAQDARHLWPEWFRLIGSCRPAVVVGEQVAGAVGKGWLDGVSADLEGAGYAFRPVDVPACAVDAPHQRHRVWFVADAATQGRRLAAAEPGGSDEALRTGQAEPGRRGGPLPLGDADAAGSPLPEQRGEPGAQERGLCPGAAAGERGGAPVPTGALGDAHSDGRPQPEGLVAEFGRQLGDASAWSGAGWLVGADGKARRVGTDFRRLVDGLPAGMAGLCADVFTASWQEVRRHGQATSSRPDEVLRAVWLGVLSDPTPIEAVGKQDGVSKAEILLSFLCELHRRHKETDAPFQSQEALEEAMRSVRHSTIPSRTPHQWRNKGEQSVKHSDIVQALSLILAQHAAEAWSEYRRSHASPMALLGRGIPARVQKLRAFGNAIVPQVAAEVIGAYLEGELT